MTKICIAPKGEGMGTQTKRSWGITSAVKCDSVYLQKMFKYRDMATRAGDSPNGFLQISKDDPSLLNTIYVVEFNNNTLWMFDTTH